MKYIREQKDPLTRAIGGYHRYDSFIEFRVLKSKEWQVFGIRAMNASNVTFARFDTQEEAEEALADLMECLTDPKAEDLVCPWPLEYVSGGTNLPVSSAGEAK